MPVVDAGHKEASDLSLHNYNQSLNSSSHPSFREFPESRAMSAAGDELPPPLSPTGEGLSEFEERGFVAGVPGGGVYEPLVTNAETREEGLGGWYDIRLTAAFWSFGIAVAMQFSVVLTAANDLVGSRASTGLVLFAYTVPAVCVRTFVPYLPPSPLSYFPFGRSSSRAKRRNSNIRPHERDNITTNDRGLTSEINYPARILICATSSFVGLQLLAWCSNLPLRLLGISLASVSSNLGDMSFFQLTTRYPLSPRPAFGGYAAGGGMAGLLGAAYYTFMTTTLRLSPNIALSLTAVGPCALPFVYGILLPGPKGVEKVVAEQMGGVGKGARRGSVIGELELRGKLGLVRELVWGYMMPLATLFFIENVLNQGVLPTLVFYTPIPGAFEHLFHNPRDFYPIYMTLHQLLVFLARTSISFFRLPFSSTHSFPLWSLSILDLVIFALQFGESASMKGATGESAREWYGVGMVMVGVAVVGANGGLGMSNTYWKLGKEPLPEGVWRALARARARVGAKGGAYTELPDSDETDEYDSPHDSHTTGTADSATTFLGLPTQTKMGPRDAEEETAVREFLISTIAPADTFAILMGSFVAMGVQTLLCGWQVEGGGRFVGCTDGEEGIWCYTMGVLLRLGGNGI
ncbi:battenin CLN3 protein [Saitoella coloradoensis]